MSDFAYSIAVKLSLVNLVSPGLRLLSKEMKATAGDVSKLEGNLMRLGKSAAAAGIVAAAGFAGLRMFKGPIEEAKRYHVELQKIAALNLGAGVVDHADRFARNANIIGTSMTKMAESYGDALAIFKNTREADFVAPIMAKLGFANNALYGSEGGGARTGAMYSLLKAIEYRGGTRSEAAFLGQADDATKIINASRGRVDGRQLLNVMQTGGILAKTMSNDAFYLKSEPLIQEMGGFRFGTGLNAIYGNLGQGRGSITSQQELYRLGLLNPALVQFNNQGRLKRALPGAFSGMDALNSGGVQGLLENVLLPAFARKGITGDKAVLSELGMVASNSRGANLLATAYQQRQKLAVQSGANAKAWGLGATVGAAGRTVQGQEANLLAREATLKAQIGMTILPLYVRGLQMTANVLQSISNFAEHHRAAFGAIVGGFAALSGVMAVGGTLKLASIAIEGLSLLGGVARVVPILGTVAGIIGGPLTIGLGLAAGAAYLVYRNWNTVGPKLSAMWDGVKGAATSAASWVADKASKVWAPVQERLNKLGDIGKALGYLAGDAWNSVKGDLSKRWEGLKTAAAPYLKAAQSMWDGVGALFRKFWGWLEKGIGNLATVIGQKLAPMVDLVTASFSGMLVPLKMIDAELTNMDKWARDINAQHQGLPAGPNVIRPASGIINVTVPVHVGNRHLTTHVVKVINDGMGRPRTGGNSPDGSMSPSHPSSPWGR